MNFNDSSLDKNIKSNLRQSNAPLGINTKFSEISCFKYITSFVFSYNWKNILLKNVRLYYSDRCHTCQASRPPSG